MKIWAGDGGGSEDGLEGDVGVFKEGGGGVVHLLLFFRGDGVEWGAVGGIMAVFNLGKIDFFGVNRDDVDFVRWGFVVAGDDGVAMGLEIIGNDRFGVRAGECCIFYNGLSGGGSERCIFYNTLVQIMIREVADLVSLHDVWRDGAGRKLRNVILDGLGEEAVLGGGAEILEGGLVRGGTITDMTLETIIGIDF